jgi:predicted DNA-binding transcriptional regulator AlpA
MSTKHPLQQTSVFPDRIVRIKEAVEISGFCDVHIRRLETAGQFPRRFKLADSSGTFGAVGWRLSDILAWIEGRASQSQDKDWTLNPQHVKSRDD